MENAALGEETRPPLEVVSRHGCVFLVSVFELISRKSKGKPPVWQVCGCHQGTVDSQFTNNFTGIRFAPLLLGPLSVSCSGTPPSEFTSLKKDMEPAE